MMHLHEDNPLTDEQLLSRLVEGTADADDWGRWSHAARGDAEAWRELAQMQADHGRVQRVMGRAADVADHMMLPAEPHVSPVVLRLSAWSGWAMAAMVALAAIVWHFNLAGQQVQAPTNGAIPAADMSASDAFNAYIERGRDEGTVVNELPTRVLVDVRESPDGGYQLLYLRQVLERVHVPDLYMIEPEAGADTEQPAAMQASYVNNNPPRRGPM